MPTALRDPSHPCGGHRFRGIWHVWAPLVARSGKRHPDRVPALPHGGVGHLDGSALAERVRVRESSSVKRERRNDLMVNNHFCFRVPVCLG